MFLFKTWRHKTYESQHGVFIACTYLFLLSNLNGLLFGEISAFVGTIDIKRIWPRAAFY